MKRWYALRCGRARTCSHSGSSRTSAPTWSSASNTATSGRPAPQEPEERGAVFGVPRDACRRRRRSGRASRGRSRRPARPRPRRRCSDRRDASPASVGRAAPTRSSRSTTSSSRRRSRCADAGRSAHAARIPTAPRPRRLIHADLPGGIGEAAQQASASAAPTTARRSPVPGACSRSERPPVTRCSATRTSSSRSFGRDLDVIVGDRRPRDDTRERPGRSSPAARPERRYCIRPRPGPLERVEVAEAAGAVLEVRLEHLGHRPRPRVARRRPRRRARAITRDRALHGERRSAFRCRSMANVDVTGDDPDVERAR